MPFGYAERVTLSADSLAERWRWLQRPGGSVGSVRHVLTKQESRQQEAGTQVPPPPPPVGSMATSLSGSSPSRNSRVEKRQTSFPVTGHWSTARTAGQYASRCPLWAPSPDHTASWEAWLYRLWSSLIQLFWDPVFSYPGWAVSQKTGRKTESSTYAWVATLLFNA